MGGNNDIWRNGWGAGGVATPHRGLNLTTLRRADQAIQTLIDCNYFFEGTKNQFAIKMNWYLGSKPDRRLVEDVCNLTRDQDLYPPAKELLGGFTICYSPSKGGLLLQDPDGDLPLDHQLFRLSGDLQAQQKIKTINRRRLPSWKVAAEQAFKTGDLEVSRICWQAANDIEHTGFVSDHLIAEFFKTAAARGLG